MRRLSPPTDLTGNHQRTNRQKETHGHTGAHSLQLFITLQKSEIYEMHEAGTQYLFGARGEYSRERMQQGTDRGELAMDGTCNELNGAAAVDGYFELHGLAALVVTNAAVALSANWEIFI